MNIRAEKHKRAGLAKEARAILDTANEDGGRELTAEESEKFDRLMDEADKIDDSVAREERLRAKESARAETGDDDSDPERNGPDEGAGDDKMRAFRQYLAGGRSSLSPEQVRALNVGSDPEGGFLVAPMQFVQDLIKNIDDEVPLRPLATVETLTEAESLGVPSLDTDLQDAEWTSEIATGSQDDALRFGRRELHPNPLAKRVLVSRKLLRLTNDRAESIVRDRLAYKFAVSQEKAFMTGDGNKKPLGLFTASTMGISTSRDSTFGAAGAIPLTAASADQLIDAKYTLKAGYWRNARWLYHRDIIRVIRKLKDNNSQYLWMPGISGDRPDTILEVPYVVSEFAPNTITANGYVGMIGDFSFYWIADALDMEVQRLVELYAEANRIGFIGRMETDGMPVLEEPFVRLKVPA